MNCAPKALNTTNEILRYYIQLVQKNILLLAGEWESRISQPGFKAGVLLWGWQAVQKKWAIFTNALE